MKAIVILFTVCFVGVLDALTDEQIAKLRTYKASCINETGVDPTVVENAKKGEIAEDEKFACFATCMLKKIGILNADESINLEVARAKIPPSIPQDQVDLLFNKCQSITGNGCEKGGKLFKCFLGNTVSILA